MASVQAHNPPSNKTPEFDEVIQRIAKYVHNYEIKSDLALSTARYCLIDTIGCGLEALHHKECTKMLGPLTEGTSVTNGAKVPGTKFELDPVEAARNFGTMIRWLDFNDTVNDSGKWLHKMVTDFCSGSQLNGVIPRITWGVSSWSLTGSRDEVRN